MPGWVKHKQYSARGYYVKNYRGYRAIWRGLFIQAELKGMQLFTRRRRNEVRVRIELFLSSSEELFVSIFKCLNRAISIDYSAK